MNSEHFPSSKCSARADRFCLPMLYACLLFPRLTHPSPNRAHRRLVIYTAHGSHGLTSFLSPILHHHIQSAGELLDSLPPGVDEAVAISKVVQLARSPQYSSFSHVIFDTAPTGHTLRLLTLPEFLDATIGVSFAEDRTPSRRIKFVL